MINKNILHIIIDNTALNQWKNKVSNINKEYKQLYSFDDLSQDVNCNRFFFNFRNLDTNVDSDNEICHRSYVTISDTGKFLPKYYFYSIGSKKKNE